MLLLVILFKMWGKLKFHWIAGAGLHIIQKVVYIITATMS